VILLMGMRLSAYWPTVPTARKVKGEVMGT
jgi:hypothetical protein